MIGGLAIAAVVGPLVGVVLWLTARVAAAGRLTRNKAVGIRTAATRASDAAWQAGHRAAVTPSLVGLLLLILSSGPA